MTFDEFEQLVSFRRTTRHTDEERGLQGFEASLVSKARWCVDYFVYRAHEEEVEQIARESCLHQLWEALQKEFGHTEAALRLAFELGRSDRSMTFHDVMEIIEKEGI